MDLTGRDSLDCIFDYYKMGQALSPKANDVWNRGDNVTISWYGGKIPNTTITDARGILLAPEESKDSPDVVITLFWPYVYNTSVWQAMDSCNNTKVHYNWTVPLDMNLTSTASLYRIYLMPMNATTEDLDPDTEFYKEAGWSEPFWVKAGSNSTDIPSATPTHSGAVLTATTTSIGFYARLNRSVFLLWISAVISIWALGG
ncbi:hypothetical protein CGLO_01022 [Colletotrichum gloeosporioides Cg-14]|uniref:Uncharacterized protein n=1 Tax=Colletotrichum gloeosporioides (strain Cg-14) TaxID=1237896 RepID=T0KT36_COLGC|nr:hypothetical protein CGLO_01022 [Colletotrichum gloeosporioides Cg-14]